MFGRVRGSAARPLGRFVAAVRANVLAAGFGASVVLLSIAFAASIVDAQRMASIAAQVDELHRVLAQLRTLSLDVERVVTIGRVFVLSGAEEYVAPLGGTTARIESSLDTLRDAFAADEAQAARLAALEGLIARRVAMTDEYITLRRSSDLQKTVEQIPSGGEDLARRIRGEIASLEQAEASRLDAGRAEAAAMHTATLWTIGFSGASSLVVLLAVFAALRSEIKQRVVLEQEIIEVGEQERQRIGRDLHDGLGQELTGISLSLQVLAQGLQREGSPAARAAERLRALVQDSIQETRRIARALAPTYLADEGLCGALQSLSKEISENTGVRCSVQCSGEADVRDPELVVQLFRIAQEAVTNALRHSGADEIEIRCGRDGIAGWFAVRDNGAGPRAPLERIEGLGIRSMRYRAHVIGGALTVGPGPERGTEVRCSYALPAGAIGVDAAEGRQSTGVAAATPQ
jgi:signal transduction histidine kinase